MKTNRLAAALAAIVGATGLLCGSMFLFAQTKKADPTDSVVTVVADAQGLPLVPPDELPAHGTFWTVRAALPCITAPLPCPPQDRSWPVYAIGQGQFLVDQTGGVLLSQPNRFGPLSAAGAAAILDQQANELLNHVAWIQAVQSGWSEPMSLMDGGGPPVPGEGGGTNEWGGGITLNGPTPTTNDLWLEISMDEPVRFVAG